MTTTAKKKAPKRATKKAPKRATKKTKKLLDRVLVEPDFGALPRSGLWEVVDEGSVDGRTPTMFTVRAPVPGGWLVALSMRGLIAPPVYVPDATSSWRRHKPPAPVPEERLEAVVGLDALAPEVQLESASEQAAEPDTEQAAETDVTHGGDPGDEAAA